MKERLENAINYFINKNKNNHFIKNFLALSAGVVVSQTVALGTTPIISRIYDPYNEPICLDRKQAKIRWSTSPLMQLL